MNLEDSDRAVRLADSIKKLQGEHSAVSYSMGRLGYFAKGMGKGFLKANNADTWTAWCAEPGNPNQRTFDKYTYLYKIFGEDGIDLPMESWSDIGPRKLDIIAKHITGDDVEDAYLLDNARCLSVSDLLTSLGRENKIKRHAETSNGDDPPVPDSPAQYKKRVKDSPCCVCGAVGGEYVQIHSHHFPQTRNLTADWKVIPLCGACHRECHDDPKEFLWKYKANIFGWFYSLAVK